MAKNKKLSFTSISKQKDLILINDMQELQKAFDEKQQIIGLKQKTKTVDGPNNPGGNKKPPKYFTDFKNQMLDFIKKQEKFNSTVLSVLDKIVTRLDKIEQRLDRVEQRLDRVEQRLNNIVKKNNLKE